jgi:cell shape-determining protein MreC
VATVTQVTKDPTLPYAVITAIPAAQLEKAREVLLVWPTRHKEDKPEKLEKSEKSEKSTKSKSSAGRVKKP